jgi:inorganic pyrophosphatase
MSGVMLPQIIDKRILTPIHLYNWKNHQPMPSLFKAHPWHGIDPGLKLPEEVTAFIELVPTDTVKYEIDRDSGYLTIDRPQKFSNVPPALYGFIPRTFCGNNIAQYDALKTGRSLGRGDSDPLDICVLCERTISHGDILLHSIPIGGIRMTDKGETDDKIIAVLKDDGVFSSWNDIYEVPKALINRLKHYFLTYKNIPGEEPRVVEIIDVFGKKEAHEVILKCIADYQVKFGNAKENKSMAFEHPG